jgi:hypothetical protein
VVLFFDADLAGWVGAYPETPSPPEAADDE